MNIKLIQKAKLSTMPIEPRTTDLCLVLEDITQAYEQGDIEHEQIYTELLKHNPFTPKTSDHTRYCNWANITAELIKDPIEQQPDSPAYLLNEEPNHNTTTKHCKHLKDGICETCASGGITGGTGGSSTW